MESYSSCPAKPWRGSSTSRTPLPGSSINTKTQNSTPTLHHLHWLPVNFRITFKILLLTYKALHGLAPSYFSDLLHTNILSSCLHSSDSGLLTIPKIRLYTTGDWAFSAASPKLWNYLPQPPHNSDFIATFKNRLNSALAKLSVFSILTCSISCYVFSLFKSNILLLFK
jgi:hypothetical protein